MNLPDDAGVVLTGLARFAIAKALRVVVPAPADAAWLDTQGASFVTLTQDGQLRGCIGSLLAWRTLRDDVISNAQAAALHDPRFMRMQASELPVTRIEVSVLSTPQPMQFSSRADALAQLRPGVDGVILSAVGLRATFLPQVWDELPNPEQFIGHLLRKAGLASTYWSDAVTLSRYTVTAFIEDEPNP
ncbi:MAG: AmmeMemoRadiSam system protein A [Propionibacteriaceae bacterium]|nr:AmmeMemoRadiSam system protein A [Propionibacteriaceae bacterium]